MYILKLVVCACLSVAIIVGLTVYVRLMLNIMRNWRDDTAIGARIDNAETDISANSADLTGIKGLTYGEGGQVFLENENGSYSSPALVEIRHEISNLQSQGGGISGSTTWGEIEQP